MAAQYSQDNRPMAVSTAAGKDALLLERIHGTEGLNELFSYHLELLAHPQRAIKFDALVGQPATVALVPRNSQTVRYINGILCRFGQAGIVRGANGDHTFTRFSATLVPTLWKLTKTHRSRIFQQENVKDILKKVLRGIDTDFRLTGTYEPRDYCVQYQETDFAFASRLMEEEGIFYYFTHADGKHTMVLGDAPGAHDPIPGQTELIFDDLTGDGQYAPEDRIRGWNKSQELQSGKVTLWDHCFELPPDNLEVQKTTQGSVAVGSVTHKLALAGNDQLEVYRYPGRAAQRFDGIDPSGGERPADIQKIHQDNKRLVNLLMQQEAAKAVAVQAEGTVRTVTAGHKFSLTRHLDGDGEYVVKRVELTGDLRASYHNWDNPGTPEFTNSFSVLPAGLPFRPTPTAPKGRIQGMQAGTVVGPAGEEIFTDKYGRVKVQFRWDRDGQMDANSSCWVRVGTLWAGKQWGGIHIPRIGQEVLIAFEEGDPDRPIVVGSVYNAEQMPPYKLPDNRTQSGVKSRSSLKGNPDHFNELRFEDKKGEEQVYFHSEKDYDQVVENNMTLKVGFRESDYDPDKGDQTVEIRNDQKVTVGKPHKGNPDKGDQTLEVWNNRDVTVGNGKGNADDGSEAVKIWNDQSVDIGTGKGQNKDGSQSVTIWNNQTLEVGSGKGSNPEGTQKVTIWKDRQVAIKTGNDKLVIDKGNQNTTIKTGNRDTQIETGNDVLVLKKGNRTTSIKLGKDKTDAMQSITLKVGSSKIVIDQSGITIDAPQVKINGKMTKVSGMLVDVKANGILSMGGGLTKIG